MRPMRIMTPAEAAQFLNTTLQQLEHWRRKHDGPWFVLHGGVVRYRMFDLMRWLANERREARKATKIAAERIEAMRREMPPSFMQPYQPRD